MTDENNLEVGAFYWVIIALDPDGEDWENQKMPARYAGKNSEGEDTWNLLGVEGASDWPVIWIGDEILPNRHTFFPLGRGTNGRVELEGYTWVGDKIPPKNTLVDLFNDKHCSFFLNCIYRKGTILEREVDGSFKPVIGWTFDCWKLSEDL